MPSPERPAAGCRAAPAPRAQAYGWTRSRSSEDKRSKSPRQGRRKLPGTCFAVTQSSMAQKCQLESPKLSEDVARAVSVVTSASYLVQAARLSTARGCTRTRALLLLMLGSGGV